MNSINKEETVWNIQICPRPHVLLQFIPIVAKNRIYIDVHNRILNLLILVDFMISAVNVILQATLVNDKFENSKDN